MPYAVPPGVLDPALYRRLVRQAKKRYRVWPSAYASGWVAAEYKKAGGKYRKGTKSHTACSLQRWYKERWVNVCARDKKGNPPPCGRKTAKPGADKKYPYCRPLVRVTKDTPATVAEIGAKKAAAMCKKKRKEGIPKKGKPRRVSR